MPKIELNDCLQVSQNVLSKVEELIPTELARECCILVMSNQREQAFVIRRYPAGRKQIQVAFCQHRIEDDIVVYWGDIEDFDSNTNQPNRDDVWERVMSFRYNQVEAAALWIINFLSAKS